MDFDLITEDDYASLPVDPQRKFVALEQICRRNMNKLINSDSRVDFDRKIENQYMTLVASAAEVLGIQGISYSGSVSIDEFQRKISGITARIRLLSSPGKDGLSVHLANKTKGIIENELSKLRSAILNSDLNEVKKKRLLGKLEDFRTELHKDRFNFGTGMAALLFVGGGLVGTTSLLADAPDALETITRLIGVDQVQEEEEVYRLEAPYVPLALPAPSAEVA